jgi:hypothetical protein
MPSRRSCSPGNSRRDGTRRPIAGAEACDRSLGNGVGDGGRFVEHAYGAPVFDFVRRIDEACRAWDLRIEIGEVRRGYHTHVVPAATDAPKCVL